MLLTFVLDLINSPPALDWLQSLKQVFINVSYHILVHARIQEFSSGGGGGPGQYDKKKSSDIFFLVLSLVNKSPTFSRVGGSNCLFPIETHIACDFPGGGGVRIPCPPPPPPLDPHLLVASHTLMALF